MAELKCNACLLCDQMRREDNGKALLIGVFCGGLVFRSLPTTKQSLELYISGDAPVEDFEVQYRLIRKGSRSPLKKGAGRFEYQGDDDAEFMPIDFSLKLGPVQFADEGDYSVQLKQGKKRWKSVVNFEVVLQEGKQVNQS